MPEGPEVKIITEQLAKEIVGKYLQDIEFGPTGRYKQEEPEGSKELLKALPLQILKVSCKGKFIYWELENEWSMWNTLGMTGNWRCWEWPANVDKHTSVLFLLSSNKHDTEGDSVCFSDIRHFGTVKFVKGTNKLNKKLDSLGPDMLSAVVPFSIFDKIIKFGKSKTIVEILMDQKYISGVGNYIKAESLYRAGISPWRKCNTLSDNESAKLYQEIKTVLQESYQAQGNTFSTYKNVLGESGNYVSQLKVYGKDIDPLGNKVISEETKDKRTSWWVPGVQK